MSFLRSRARSAPQGVGKPVRRKEDAWLVTGQGCYSVDFSVPGQAYVTFVRSPHAHARIRRIDSAAALAVTGVMAVLAGEDALAELGVEHVEMPATPERVWRAIRAADTRAGRA